MTDQKAVDRFNRWIHESNSTVFFGGAGVSTESGVPDFRSPTGIYAQKGGAERYLTVPFMNRHPDEFYDFYREYFMMHGIEPNAAHRKLAEMEAKGRLDAIVTQNVDGLHQKAGSHNVFELHGNGNTFYCQRCYTQYDFDTVDAGEGPFYCQCEGCDGLVRPDIVFYGESLDGAVLTGAIRAIEEADLLIVGGSSLTVYPAAGLIHYKKPSARLVLINLQPTPYDGLADLAFNEPIGALFSRLEIEPK
ncbi:MAG: NAD-dependent protein deacylase [Saccharofermentanales bacterium]|jgi:NAD-dependent deacetylase